MMVLFWPIQQELDCINENGVILGKIKFNIQLEAHIFEPVNDSISLSLEEESSINKKISEIDSGRYAIPMQDDD